MYPVIGVPLTSWDLSDLDVLAHVALNVALRHDTAIADYVFVT